MCLPEKGAALSSLQKGATWADLAPARVPEGGGGDRDGFPSKCYPLEASFVSNVSLFVFAFLFLNLYWSIVALQCCVSTCLSP